MPYTSLCLCSLDSDKKPPPPGARLPWAMTPCINRIFTVCSHAGGVSFSSLSPFLFRFILSCIRSSFSIKEETDRDRTLPRRGRAESAASVPMSSFCAPMSSPPGSHPRGLRLPRLAEPRSPVRSRSSVRRSLSSPLSPLSAAVRCARMLRPKTGVSVPVFGPCRSHFLSRKSFVSS